MARNKEDELQKIGKEGFATLEDHLYRNPRKHPRQQQPQYSYYRFPQQPYMNILDPNYNYSVPPRKEDVIDSKEAAKHYGEVLFKEAGPRRKKKPLFSFGFPKAE